MKKLFSAILCLFLAAAVLCSAAEATALPKTEGKMRLLVTQDGEEIGRAHV